MNELIDLTLKMHGSFVGILLLTAVFNYFFLDKDFEVKTIKKRVRMILPAYYLILSLILFTGLVLLGAVQFTNLYSFVVFSMIAVWIFILVTCIKSYKKMKFLQKEDINSYLRFYKRKYLADISLLIFVSGLSYMLGN